MIEFERDEEPVQSVVTTRHRECPDCGERRSYRSNSVIVRCPVCGHQWNPFGIELEVDNDE